jgi:hypothetical protein
MMDHFKLGDDLIAHLRELHIGRDQTELLRYTGFVAVSAVTVFELVVKEEFCSFASQKHNLLGVFTSSYFDKINGKVRVEVLKKEYLKRFGDEFRDEFARILRSVVRTQLSLRRRDIERSYENIITWRNEFAHAGKAPANATFDEVCDAYDDGKLVLRCLRVALYRVGTKAARAESSVR